MGRFSGLIYPRGGIKKEETRGRFSCLLFSSLSYGNALTETTFKDGEFGTIYRSFGYDSSSNNLISETDARGNFTNYTVDSETSRERGDKGTVLLSPFWCL